MEIHLGTDIVYIPRIKAALDRFGERFLQRVYTSAEQQECWKPDSSPSTSKDKVARLAGRWAAKEAVAKALGTGWRGISYTEIEIQRQLSGAPQVHLYGAAAAKVVSWGDCQWQLSLSHDKDYAIATAIIFCTL